MVLSEAVEEGEEPVLGVAPVLALARGVTDTLPLGVWDTLGLGESRVDAVAPPEPVARMVSVGDTLALGLGDAVEFRDSVACEEMLAERVAQGVGVCTVVPLTDAVAFVLTVEEGVKEALIVSRGVTEGVLLRDFTTVLLVDTEFEALGQAVEEGVGGTLRVARPGVPVEHPELLSELLSDTVATELRVVEGVGALLPLPTPPALGEAVAHTVELPLPLSGLADRDTVTLGLPELLIVPLKPEEREATGDAEAVSTMEEEGLTVKEEAEEGDATSLCVGVVEALKGGDAEPTPLGVEIGVLQGQAEAVVEGVLSAEGEDTAEGVAGELPLPRGVALGRGLRLELPEAVPGGRDPEGVPLADGAIEPETLEQGEALVEPVTLRDAGELGDRRGERVDVELTVEVGESRGEEVEERVAAIVCVAEVEALSAMLEVEEKLKLPVSVPGAGVALAQGVARVLGESFAPELLAYPDIEGEAVEERVSASVLLARALAVSEAVPVAAPEPDTDAVSLPTAEPVATADTLASEVAVAVYSGLTVGEAEGSREPVPVPPVGLLEGRGLLVTLGDGVVEGVALRDALVEVEMLEQGVEEGEGLVLREALGHAVPAGDAEDRPGEPVGVAESVGGAEAVAAPV